jgi:nucleoside-diphosphate-sugar epimerase
MLENAGHAVRRFDFRLDGGAGDIRDPDAVDAALAGADAVVHAAALHGIHLEHYPPQDFWKTNADGTFNVYVAARTHCVERIVLCSTMGVYGPRFDVPVVITDDTAVRPTDVYGLSKAVAEEVARTYAAMAGVATVGLRLGMFVTEPWERYGFRLLFGGVDVRDVADAVVRALSYDAPSGFAAFNIMAEVPFDDPEAFARDPAAVIERYWPGASKLGFDLDSLIWSAIIWRSDNARKELGWQPRYGFGEFLDAHRRGDRDHPLANEGQWGVER